MKPHLRDLREKNCLNSGGGGPYKVPVCAINIRKYRNYGGNRHFSACWHGRWFASVRSDFTVTVVGNRHYRGITAVSYVVDHRLFGAEKSTSAVLRSSRDVQRRSSAWVLPVCTMSVTRLVCLFVVLVSARKCVDP